MAENLLIAGTEKTPAVSFKSDGHLEISGKSIPENSVEFYKPLLTWLDDYASGTAPGTEFKVVLEYFNTSSSKCLLDVLRKLENIHKSGKSAVQILWCHEADDEDILESGEDYQALIELPFKFAVV